MHSDDVGHFPDSVGDSSTGRATSILRASWASPDFSENSTLFQRVDRFVSLGRGCRCGGQAFFDERKWTGSWHGKPMAASSHMPPMDNKKTAALK